jgi:hypothetical protein
MLAQEKSSARQALRPNRCHGIIKFVREFVAVLAVMQGASGFWMSYGHTHAGQKPDRENQKGEETGDRSETYQEILDILLPRDDPAPGGKERFYMVLRFTPALDREAQLNITEYGNGEMKVIRYSVSGKPIHWQMNEDIESTGEWDPKKLASMMHVNRNVIGKPTAALRSIIASFRHLRFSPSFDREFYIDAATYTLWYKGRSATASYKLQDSYPGHPPYNSQLVRWMNNVLIAATAQGTDVNKHLKVTSNQALGIDPP